VCDDPRDSDGECWSVAGVTRVRYKLWRSATLLASATAASTAIGCMGSGAGDPGKPEVNPSSRQVMPRAGRDKLTARLTGPRLEPGQACPVTHPSDRSEQPPAQLRELVHDGVRAAYGRGPLWVVLPRADEAGVNSARDPGGRIGTKVAWYVGVQGPLRVVARRLDTDSTMTGHAEIADPGTLPYRMEPTRLDLPAQGCWQVAGSVGRNVLVWTYRARAPK